VKIASLFLLLVSLVPAMLAAQQMAEIEVATGEEPVSSLLETGDDTQLGKIRNNLEPFGHTLFSGGFGVSESSGLNGDYLVSTGDRISVRIWGATVFESVEVVDTQGNIFIPDVGPVRLGGIPNRSVNSTVKNAIAQVYTRDVEVYTNLLTAQTADVYVTGFVKKPGKYSGMPTSSVLHYIDRAGGIDERSGSFRNIQVVRNSKVISTIDLYRFIESGEIADIVLKDGDAIVVKPLMNTVYVQGEVARPFRFEFEESTLSADAIVALAAPFSGVTHVAISTVNGGQSVFDYVTLDSLADLSIGNGDVLTFKSDLNDKNITINVSGMYSGPSALTVNRRATLRQVLDLIEVDPEMSAYQSIYMKRKSIADRQKSSIQDSLRRLEAEFLTASSSTDTESRIRAQEAQLISDFVNKMTHVEPHGTLVVAERGEIADIALENDDTIVIPRQSPTVLVTGEVRLPRAFLWRTGARPGDYIKQAGGFSNNANRDLVLLVKQDGRVVEADADKVESGDELIVLPRAPTKNLQLATSITDILYKIAVATSVALKL
jgi:protein involved in polysaccharide export with SLBB domain